jgi:hypothetical protein
MDASTCSARMQQHLAGRLKLYDFHEFAVDALLPRLMISKQAGPVALHINCSVRKNGADAKLRTLLAACTDEIVEPAGVTCCGFAGDRGFVVPELNQHALRKIHDELPQLRLRRVDLTETCDRLIGLRISPKPDDFFGSIIDDSRSPICWKSAVDRRIADAGQKLLMHMMPKARNRRVVTIPRILLSARSEQLKIATLDDRYPPSHANKDEPMRNDRIRLLGRLLGDTVREQEGDAVFDIVEKVRQTAVSFARNGDPASRAELAALLDPLPRDTTQAVVRAFSYFLQLANIAEDEHHIRRRRAHDLVGSPPREGSLVHALDQLAPAKVSPEASRRLLRPRAGRPGAHRPPDGSPAPEPDPQSPRPRPPARPARTPADDAGRRGRERSRPGHRHPDPVAVAHAAPGAPEGARRGQERHQLFQGNLLHRTAAPLHPGPRSNCRSATRTPSGRCRRSSASVQLDRRRPRRQSLRHRRNPARDAAPAIGGGLNHYLDEVHELGAELPLSDLLVNTTPELHELAEHSTDQSPQRADEPYRRALSGIYARAGGDGPALDHFEPVRHEIGHAEPYATPDACAPTSRYWPIR